MVLLFIKFTLSYKIMISGISISIRVIAVKVAFRTLDRPGLRLPSWGVRLAFWGRFERVRPGLLGFHHASLFPKSQTRPN